MLDSMSEKQNIEDMTPPTEESTMGEDLYTRQELGSTNILSTVANTSTTMDHSNLPDQANSFTYMSDQPSTLEDNGFESILNMTREYPFEYALIMFGYIMPFVLIITLITNTLVVMVLYQRHMRTPTNIVLFAMAIVDLGTMLSPSPWYFYIYTFGNYNKYLYPSSWCYLHHLMTDVIPVFFHTSSIWLALLLASQRYIYVCHPTLARTWCTVPRVKKAICLILLVAILHQLTRFTDTSFVTVRVEHNRTQHLACKMEIAQWVHTIDIALYYTTYYTFRILFVFIIPCVALITLNYLLFRALKRAETKRTELLRTRFRLVDVKKKSKKTNRSNKNEIPNNLSVVNYDASKEVSDYVTPTLPPIECANLPARPPSVGSCVINTSATKECSSVVNDNLRRCSTSVGKDNKLKPTGVIYNDREEGYQSDKLNIENEMVKDKKKDERMESEGVAQEQLVDEADEDESICLECAAYEHDLRAHKSCPRCCTSNMQLNNEFNSPGTSEKTTNNQNSFDHNRSMSAIARAHHTHHHQPVSQCSSIMGGATNTTTNEDDDMSSSCLVTNQNMSTSLFAPQFGDEAASIREDGGENDSLTGGEEMQCEQTSSFERRELQQQQRTPSHTPLDLTSLIKSTSIDSRIACGCLSARAKAIRRIGLISKAKQQVEAACHKNPVGHSYSMIEDNSYTPISNNNCYKHSPSYNDRRTVSCGNSGLCSDERESGSNHRNVAAEERRRCSERRSSGRNVNQFAQVEHQEMSQVDLTRNIESDSRALIAITGNNTTTTTTLYSANTNSINSLHEVPRSDVVPLREIQVMPDNELIGCQSRHHDQLRSPILSSMATRESRATLIGGFAGASNTNIALPNSQATRLASMRTMDSNRTTLMLVVVVTVFLIVEVPVAIVTILHVVINLFDELKDIEFNATLSYIKLFTNFFIMISYSVNFTIYCSMSKKFRETFRDLFLCGKVDQRRLRHSIYQTQQSQYNQTPQPNQLQFSQVNTTTNINQNQQPFSSTPSSYMMLKCTAQDTNRTLNTTWDKNVCSNADNRPTQNHAERCSISNARHQHL